MACEACQVSLLFLNSRTTICLLELLHRSKHIYGRIDLCSAAAVSDIARNGFLSRPKTTKNIKEGRIGLFHTLLEELKLTVIMVFMEDAPTTRDSNNVALSLQHQRRREKEKLQEEQGMKDVSNEYIEALMFR